MVETDLAVVPQVQVVELGEADPRWSTALPVLQELRPHLTANLLSQVLAEGSAQGLRFTALFVGADCVAVAGWRVNANTSAIRKLHVDDLVTAAEHRSYGYGARLLDELVAQARKMGCTRIDLDSGVQRFAAHRFYLRERLDIVGHHFSRDV